MKKTWKKFLERQAKGRKRKIDLIEEKDRILQSYSTENIQLPDNTNEHDYISKSKIKAQHNSKSLNS
nr:unnamed protein product [Callosobruchus analis]